MEDSCYCNPNPFSDHGGYSDPHKLANFLRTGMIQRPQNKMFLSDPSAPKLRFPRDNYC